MKKLMMLLTGVLLVSTLAACGDKNDDPAFDVDSYKDLSHVVDAMESMNYEDAMTLRTTVKMNDEYNSLNMSQTVKMVMNNGYMTTSTESIIENEGMSFKLVEIVEEVEDGINVYLNLGEFLNNIDATSGVEEFLNIFQINEDYIMIHAPNTIEGYAEIEVMKNMLLVLALEEYSVSNYEDLEDSIEAELEMNLDEYNIDLSMVFQYLDAGNYDAIKTIIENADIEGLLQQLQLNANGAVDSGLNSMMTDVDIELMIEELESLDLEELLAKAALGSVEYEAYVNSLSDIPNIKPLLLELKEAVVLFEDEGYLADVLYVSNNLDTITQFLDFEYYAEAGVFDVSAKMDSSNVVTTFTVSPSEIPSLFRSSVKTIYDFLDDMPNVEMPFVQYLNCPPSASDCEDFSEYYDINDVFGGVDDMIATITFKPTGDKEMLIELDAKDMINSMDTGVTFSNMSMTMEMLETAEITVPTDAANASQAVQELGKALFLEQVSNDIRSLISHYHNGNYALDTEYTLSDFYEFYFGVFDTELSNVTFSGNPEYPEISFNLFWIDGTRVFDTPDMLLSIIDVVNEEDWSGNPSPTRTGLLNYIGLLHNDTTLGKIVLYFAEQSSMDDFYYREEYEVGYEK